MHRYAIVVTCLLSCGSLCAFAQDEPMPPEGVAQVGHLRGLPDWVLSVAFAPDNRLAAGTYEFARVWQVTRDGETVTADAMGDVPTSGYARSVAFSPDGELLAIGAYQQLQLIDPDLNVVAELRGHRGYVNDVEFSADGTLLVSCSDDMTIRVWNVAEQSELMVLRGHADAVWGIAVHLEGSLIASAAGDDTRLTRKGEVFVWSLEDGTIMHRLAQPEKCATSVTFTSDGAKLLSTAYDEKVNIYDPQAGTPFGFFGGHSRPTNCVLLAAEDQVAISGSGGRFAGKNEIWFFDPVDGHPHGTLDFHEGKVNSLALSADGTLLASASHDQTIALWDITQFVGSDLRPEATESTEEDESDEPAPEDTAAPSTEDPPADEAPPEDDETGCDDATAGDDIIRIGIIGLDTSHSIAFATALNADSPPAVLAGCRVVAAYPYGSRDIESSASRIPDYTVQVEALGVDVVDSIEVLLDQVDCVLLETNDGRPHLEQALLVFEAGKPVFIDKPVAGSLADAVAIYRAAEHFGVPMFSSSSLRWIGQAQEVRGGSQGRVLGCETYSPCSLEATHPDLYWYGIHGVEALYAVMGPGCETVTRAGTEGCDVVVGVWNDGRIASFRGIREGAAGYGGNAYCENAIVPLGPFDGYGPLIERIVHLFRTGESPVMPEETIEIYAFMSAADESELLGGAPVSIADVMERAEAEATVRLHELRPMEFPLEESVPAQ